MIYKIGVKHMDAIGKKIYLQPKEAVLNAISDLVELQKGKVVFSDTPNGIVHFSLKLYHNKWEYRFLVRDIGKNRSIVELELGSDGAGTESIINREYMLLDAMLVEGAKIELAEEGRRSLQQPELPGFHDSI